jgi:hypothetical protein
MNPVKENGETPALELLGRWPQDVIREVRERYGPRLAIGDRGIDRPEKLLSFGDSMAMVSAMCAICSVCLTIWDLLRKKAKTQDVVDGLCLDRVREQMKVEGAFGASLIDLRVLTDQDITVVLLFGNPQTHNTWRFTISHQRSMFRVRHEVD